MTTNSQTRLFPQSKESCQALRKDGTCILNNSICQYKDKWNCESHNVYVVVNRRAIEQMKLDELNLDAIRRHESYQVRHD